jgi:Preprotein translocase subunit SecA (ATPase, RNA helicase)
MLNPFNIISKFIKSNNQKQLDRIKKIVLKVNDYEEQISKLSEQDLKKITQELINKLKSGSSLNDLIPEAYSAVREASKRINNERHFDVQIIGGVVLRK